MNNICTNPFLAFGFKIIVTWRFFVLVRHGLSPYRDALSQYCLINCSMLKIIPFVIIVQY